MKKETSFVLALLIFLSGNGADASLRESWMKRNLLLPDENFLERLASSRGLCYERGRRSNASFYTADGAPLYPANDGAIGKISVVTLHAGMRLSRYGNPKGRYVSPAETTLRGRAMPAGSGAEFHVYIVEEEIAGAEAGITAAWFGEAGGGTQYKLPKSVAELLAEGALREI